MAPAARTLDMLGREIAGRYRIITKLGEGGMGAVYRAEQISLKRKVALKLLKPELSAEPGLVRRFNAEAELAAKLNHPNTVTLYDFGQSSDGALFIAMEFIEGESLRHVMHKSGPLTPTRLLAICDQVCASLADAHSHGIVHRDLKPDNIMLSERGKLKDVVRVLDFGIAKLRDEQGDVTQMPMTRAGDLLGTPQYMAPEQIRGEKVDARTDIYALGAMMYEAITGRLPFEAATLMAILSKHLTDLPVRPTERRPELKIPPQIDQLIMECLQKQPASRPPTMEAMAERISAIRAGLEHKPSAGPAANTANPVLGTAPTGYVTGYPAASMASPPPGVPRRATPAPGALNEVRQAMESAAGHPQTPPPMGSVAGHPQTPAPVAPQSPASFGTPPQMATPAAGYQPPPAVTPHPGGRTIPVGAPSHAAPASHAPSHVAPSHVTPSHAPSHAPSHVTPPSHITPHHLTPHPPRSYVPAHAPPRQSKAWLWAVLALLVAGGAGTGVYLATRSGDQVAAADDKKSKSSDDDDDDKSDDDIEKSDDDTDKSDDDTDIHAIGDDGEDTDDGDDGDDDEPGKVSSDFNTGAKRDFYGAKGARAGVTGQRFDSPLGFSFVAPDGFAQATDGQLTTYTGKLNGGDTMILLFGVDVTGMPVSDADLAQVGDGIALTSGGEVISTKRRTVQGVSRVAGKFDVPANGTRGEYVVFHEANLVVIVAIAAPKHLFSRSETFRTEIYERRLAMP